jgi:two-component system, NarL family, nitrate/nitrite response regulator NarL
VTRLRVLIADDHAPTRDDVREILVSDGRFEVCAEATNGPASVAAALEALPDICLLDIRMPGSGVLAAWEITSRLPTTRVVMLTVSEDEEDLFSALRSGASGYLLKDFDPLQLAEQLVGVAEGAAPLAPSVAAHVVAAFRGGEPRRRRLVGETQVERLTSREWEIVELARQGHSTAVIGERLSITTATVRSHLASGLRKLRAAGEDEAKARLPSARPGPR